LQNYTNIASWVNEGVCPYGKMCGYIGRQGVAPTGFHIFGIFGRSVNAPTKMCIFIGRSVNAPTNYPYIPTSPTLAIKIKTLINFSFFTFHFSFFINQQNPHPFIISHSSL